MNEELKQENTSHLHSQAILIPAEKVLEGDIFFGWYVIDGAFIPFEAPVDSHWVVSSCSRGAGQFEGDVLIVLKEEGGDTCPLGFTPNLLVKVFRTSNFIAGLAENLVAADSVESFASKYRKHDRYLGREKEYQDAILKTHRQELEDHGITWISHYDSTTGTLVAWSRVN